MMRSLNALLVMTVALLVVALAATYRVQQARVLHAKQLALTAAASAALAESNVAAERDRSRVVGTEGAGLRKALGDSLRMVERRVVQRRQVNDVIDRSIARERIALYQVQVAVDSFSRVMTSRPVVKPQGASLTDRDSTRRASFAIRQAPYTIAADVALPAPPDSGTLSVKVAMDPVHLEARVGCAPPNAQGIRAATVSATGPAWAAVRFDRVEQGEGLCASPALESHAASRGWFRATPLMVGAGRVVTPTGAGGWGMFVGAGWGVGR